MSVEYLLLLCIFLRHRNNSKITEDIRNILNKCKIDYLE
jgi:hypothetical protein